MSFTATQNTVRIAVGAASASVQIAASDTPAPATKARLVNTGTSSVAVVFGVSAPTAAFPTAGTAGGAFVHAVLAPSSACTVDIPVGSKYAACIGSAANGDLFITPGCESAS